MSEVPNAVAVLFVEACVQFRKARIAGQDGQVFLDAANAIEAAWPGMVEAAHTLKQALAALEQE